MRTAIVMAGILVAVGFSVAEDGIEPRVREAMRARLEKLPPDEQAKTLKRFYELRRSAVDREPTAHLPADLDSIHPINDEDRTQLERRPLPIRPPLKVAELDALWRHAVPVTKTPQRRPEEFVRRLFLDLIGRLPAPADVTEFADNPSTEKQTKLVDHLLALPQFGRRWGEYWSDVVRYRSTNQQLNRFRAYREVDWLADQFHRNRPWSEIVSDMLTAEGMSDDAPEAFFIASHQGDPVELAGEASRIFLGTQVACAQCHDHPYDPWKRDQFHELAAFFGKTSFRLRRDLAQTTGRPFTLEVGPALRLNQQYRMPDLSDPSAQGTVTQPVFLSGQPVPLMTSDAQRRDALSAFITSPKNPTFAKAFVNRIWYELVGTAFVEPIDDLSAHREVCHPEIFDALASSFAASGYDIKRLIRTIVLSAPYRDSLAQTSSRTSAGEQVPAQRLSAPVLFANLEWVLGQIDDGRAPLGRRRTSPRDTFERTFGFDPSKPGSEIEGSIPQTLLLMNNATLEQRLHAETPGTLLNKLLKTQSSAQAVIEILYLRVLGRTPTRQDVAICQAHLRSVTDRRAGFEDVLWALLNSSEFLYE